MALFSSVIQGLQSIDAALAITMLTRSGASDAAARELVGGDNTDKIIGLYQELEEVFKGDSENVRYALRCVESGIPTFRGTGGQYRQTAQLFSSLKNLLDRPTRGALIKLVDTVTQAEPDTVPIPAGPFVRGSGWFSDGSVMEPSWSQLNYDFQLGSTPVTNGEYLPFAKLAELPLPPEPPWGYPDDYPVVGVPFEKVLRYARLLATLTQKQYRLPIHKEWERAARGPHVVLNEVMKAEGLSPERFLKKYWNKRFQNAVRLTRDGELRSNTPAFDSGIPIFYGSRRKMAVTRDKSDDFLWDFSMESESPFKTLAGYLREGILIGAWHAYATVDGTLSPETAWYDKNRFLQRPGMRRPAPVTARDPNRYGVHGMTGNVYEMVLGCRLVDKPAFTEASQTTTDNPATVDDFWLAQLSQQRPDYYQIPSFSWAGGSWATPKYKLGITASWPPLRVPRGLPLMIPAFLDAAPEDVSSMERFLTEEGAFDDSLPHPFLRPRPFLKPSLSLLEGGFRLAAGCSS